MAQLGIKGHYEKDKEVIEILEMLGGVNVFNLEGSVDSYCYYIDYCNKIYSCLSAYAENVIVYTLEEFIEKFPYNVGDKVIYEDKIREITKMIWEEQTNTIAYKLDDKLYCNVIDDLQPYKEQETIDKTKFPYEIGTRVSVKGVYFDKLATIVGLSYNSCACMQYEIQFDGEDVVVHYPTNLMTPIITEQSMGEKDEKTVNHVFDTDVISFDFAQKNEYELDLQGKFEVVLREGKYYVERIKLKYPKDYVECCKVLGYEPDEDEISCYQGHLIELFVKLLICRDAYWKMGLGKPWKPDWESETEQKYTIVTDANKICSGLTIQCNAILAFPTEEMRDAFYENFNEEIEMCKELL